jgi:hypothetical protein
MEEVTDEDDVVPSSQPSEDLFQRAGSLGFDEVGYQQLRQALDEAGTVPVPRCPTPAPRRVPPPVPRNREPRLAPSRLAASPVRDSLPEHIVDPEIIPP